MIVYFSTNDNGILQRYSTILQIDNEWFEI